MFIILPSAFSMGDANRMGSDNTIAHVVVDRPNLSINSHNDNSVNHTEQNTSVTKIYNKNNSFKYVTFGAIFGGILFVIYKIWKANHD